MSRYSKERSQENYRLLLASAEQLFSERGYRATSLTAIAQQAQLSRGAIYWHFRGKAEVLAAVLKDISFPWDMRPPLRPHNCHTIANELCGNIEQILSSRKMRNLASIILRCKEEDGEANSIIDAQYRQVTVQIYQYLIHILRPLNCHDARTLIRIRQQARLLRTYLDGIFYRHLVNAQPWSKQQTLKELEMMVACGRHGESAGIERKYA